MSLAYLNETWGQVCVNGRLVAAGDAVTSVMDRGLLYGDGVFETIRVYSGKPFMLDAHLARMAAGCSVIGIPMPDADTIGRWVAEVLRANKRSDAYLRIVVTRGVSDGVWFDTKCCSPTTVIITKPYTQPEFGQGMRLIVSESARSDERSPLPAVKHTGLLWKILARTDARRAGVDDAIMLNTQGNVAEATAANVFWARNGALYTPSLECGILAGVTRAVVIDIARKLGIHLAEGKFPPDDLLSADEAFLTSSTWELAPVHSLSGTTYKAAPGPMTSRLAEKYRQVVSAHTA